MLYPLSYGRPSATTGGRPDENSRTARPTRNQDIPEAPDTAVADALFGHEKP
jgi:hypothetical protein